MSNAKIKVPEDVLDKVADKCGSVPTVFQCCTAFAEVLAENPIVPTDEQWESVVRWYNAKMFADGGVECAVEWQRRMFNAPDPEPYVPEEIKDLLRRDTVAMRVNNPYNPEINYSTTDAEVNRIALEAFRRGQKAGQP